jgi:hypothetical protein
VNDTLAIFLAPNHYVLGPLIHVALSLYIPRHGAFITSCLIREATKVSFVSLHAVEPQIQTTFMLFHAVLTVPFVV